MGHLSESLLATARSASRFVHLSNQYHKSAPEAVPSLHRLLKSETAYLMRKASTVFFKLMITRKRIEKNDRINKNRHVKTMPGPTPKGGKQEHAPGNNLHQQT